MIHLFPAGFVKPSARAGYATITFEIDDENRSMVEKILNSPMGKQFLIVAYEIGDDATEIQKLHKDKGQAKNSLLKQIHAIVGEYSVETGVSQEKIKHLLKVTLKAKKKLISSMSELDEVGLATAIYTLKTQMHPRRFDYSEYLQDEESTQPDKGK